MPRRLRRDYPGAWHHVFNRGVAKRTLFEGDGDVRLFQSLLARRVRAGEIEVHAFAFLNTHFHLLVRSPHGRLPSAMQRVQDLYARRFNIGRRRDGPLFRGRYGNRIIESDTYWTTVVAYIHANPVSAGLVRRQEAYRHASGRFYAEHRGPPWLRMDLVGEVLGPDAGLRGGAGMGPGVAWVVGRRLNGGGADLEDPLDTLVGAPPDEVLAWMERKARLADGTRPGWVLLSPDAVRQEVEGRRSRGLPPPLPDRPRAPPGWEVIEAGALRAFSGLSQDEVALRMTLPRGTSRERIKAYSAAFRGSVAFRRWVADLLAGALARDFPGSEGARSLVSLGALLPPASSRTGA